MCTQGILLYILAFFISVIWCSSNDWSVSRFDFMRDCISSSVLCIPLLHSSHSQGNHIERKQRLQELNISSSGWKPNGSNYRMAHLFLAQLGRSLRPQSPGHDHQHRVSRCTTYGHLCSAHVFTKAKSRWYGPNCM